MKKQIRKYTSSLMLLFFVHIMVFWMIGCMPLQAPVSSVNSEDVLGGRIIVIDPGHGGIDRGAIGASRTEEAGLNLSVSKYLEEELMKLGADVVMTRHDETTPGSNKRDDMYKRRMVIEQSNADVVVSVHMNAHPDRSISGPMVYYHKESENAQKLAQAIQTELNDALGPVKPKQIKVGDYYILKSGAQPCVIVECGFISNAREERLLQQRDYQMQISQAIAVGIIKYFSSQPTVGLI